MVMVMIMVVVILVKTVKMMCLQAGEGLRVFNSCVICTKLQVSCLSAVKTKAQVRHPCTKSSNPSKVPRLERWGLAPTCRREQRYLSSPHAELNVQRKISTEQGYWCSLEKREYRPLAAVGLG